MKFYVQIKVSSAFYDLRPKISLCWIAENVWFRQTSENVCVLMCQLFRLLGGNLTCHGPSMTLENVLYADILVGIKFKGSQTSEKSVLAPLHGKSGSGIGKGLLLFTQSISYSDTRKWSRLWVNLPPDRNQCVKSCLYKAYFVHRLLSVG